MSWRYIELVVPITVNLVDSSRDLNHDEIDGDIQSNQKERAENESQGEEDGWEFDDTNDSESRCSTTMEVWDVIRATTDA